MHLLEDIVDKTYVISLHDSVRMPRITAHLADLGIEWQRFAAADYRNLDLPQLIEWGFAKKTRANGLDFVPGEVACMLSHMGCWLEMVRMGHQRALILEDDASFVVPPYRVRETLLQAPADYDMLHLQTLYIRNKQWKDERPLVNKLWRRGYRESAGSTAYILTLKTACYLLAKSLPPHECADAITNHPSIIPGWNAYVTDEVICRHSGEPKQIRRATDGVDPAV